MFKKIFKQLTQSAEDLYQEELEQFAATIAGQGAPQLAEVMRRFAKLKRTVDQQLATNDRSMLQIDGFGEMAHTICDATRGQIQELAKVERELAEVLTGCNPQRWASHQQKWQAGSESLMRAFATLKHAATGVGSPAMDELPLGDSKKSALDAAVEALATEVRTAERIRNELG